MTDRTRRAPGAEDLLATVLAGAPRLTDPACRGQAWLFDDRTPDEPAAGKDMQLDAAEFLRRAERGLGVAIREGQANGTVETPAESKVRRGRNAVLAREEKLGRSKNYKFQAPDKLVPYDVLTSNELHGSGPDKGGSVYAMTDGVSDDQFDQAVSEARAEGNMSRANVARKCKAKAAAAKADEPAEDVTPEPVPIPPEPTPPKPPKPRLTKHDSTEMLANISGMLTGVVQSVQFMDPEDIDATENRAVIQAIRTSLGAIRRLLPRPSTATTARSPCAVAARVCSSARRGSRSCPRTVAPPEWLPAPHQTPGPPWADHERKPHDRRTGSSAQDVPRHRRQSRPASHLDQPSRWILGAHCGRRRQP